MKIIALQGRQRCGKTTTLKRLIETMLDKGTFYAKVQTQPVMCVHYVAEKRVICNAGLAATALSSVLQPLLKK